MRGPVRSMTRNKVPVDAVTRASAGDAGSGGGESPDSVDILRAVLPERRVSGENP